MKSAEVKVKDHYGRLCVPNDRSNPTIVSIQFIINYIKILNTKCSPGIDGIYSEHLKYAVNSSIPLHISTLISLCVTYGHVPDSFFKGILIPIIKKRNLTPSNPRNYRPIIMSTTFSKLLELHILNSSNEHSFDPMQFGFVDGRGTNMAVSLASDVSQFCYSQAKEGN